MERNIFELEVKYRTDSPSGTGDDSILAGKSTTHGNSTMLLNPLSRVPGLGFYRGVNELRFPSLQAEQ